MTKNEKSDVHIYVPENLKQEQTTNSKTEQPFKSRVDIDDRDQKLTQEIRKKLGEEHSFDYRQIENLTKKSGLLGAVIDKIRDYTLGDGIKIKSKDDNIYKTLTNFIKRTVLDLHLDPWFKEGLTKGQGYMEIAGLTKENAYEKVGNINSNTIYKKRDKQKRVSEYRQYFKDLKQGMKDDDITKLDKDEIIEISINKIGNGTYGLGIVYPGLSIIDDFLGAQKSLHTLMRRKANNPIHVKLGNEEKEDYPSQKDINGFGKNMQYMNESTEWVTGPNVEMKVLDFGDVGEKFKEVLNNDLKLMSYAFQIPEVVLGAESSYAGSAKFQTGGEDDTAKTGFWKTIKAYRRIVEYVLRTQIFDKVLMKNGITNYDYEICWDDMSDKEKREKIKMYNEMLGSKTQLSVGMRKEIEKKIAELEEIDYDEIKNENDREKRRNNREKKKDFQKQMQLQQNDKSKESIDDDEISIFINDNQDKAPQEIESMLVENFNLDEHTAKHYYEVLSYDIDDSPDFSLTEWLNFDLGKVDKEIKDVIEQDNFVDLAAKNRKEIYMGKLNGNQVKELRAILKSAVTHGWTVNQISKKIKAIDHFRDRYIMKDGKKVLSLNKAQRAKMIARTEVTRVANEGVILGAEKKGVTELIYRTSAGACPICAPYEGTEYPFEEAYGVLPRHPNCRCYFEEKR